MSAAKKIATIAAPVKAALVARAKLFEAKSYEKPGLTAEQVVEVKQAFDLFDTDGTGSIDTKELKAAMVSLGFDSKNTVVFQMIADLDEDQSGLLEFDEFLYLMTNRITDKDSRANYRKVFNLYDDERTGYISIKNLRRVAKDLGEDIQEEELQQMIVRADLDHDDLVSEEEFYQFLTRKVTPN